MTTETAKRNLKRTDGKYRRPDQRIRGSTRYPVEEQEDVVDLKHERYRKQQTRRGEKGKSKVRASDVLKRTDGKYRNPDQRISGSAQYPVVDVRLERYRKHETRLGEKGKSKATVSDGGKKISTAAKPKPAAVGAKGCPVSTKKHETEVTGDSSSVPEQKRRKLDTTLEPSGDVADYVVNFREQLLNGIASMTEIRHFTEVANLRPHYFQDYLDGGGTLQPLLDMLDSCEKKKLTDIAYMLNIIHFVLIKSLVFNEEQERMACKSARHIMHNYSAEIARLLRGKCDESEARKTCAFRILKAVMLVDAQTYARDVLKLMDVCMPELEMHRNRESIERLQGPVQTSLRTVFIEFNLTFLIDTPPLVVRLWLTRPHLVQPLAQNLVYDHAEHVILVMRSLRQYVLECPAIDKYIYLTVFTTDLLKALVHTYEWVGPEKLVPTADMQKALLDATEEVVMPLLTSKRHFLVLKSIDLDRGCHRQKHILLALKNSQLHAHQRRLVLRVFETCPEVMPAVLENFGGLLKTKVADNRELLLSILKLLKPEEIVAGLSAGSVSAKSLSNFVIKSTLPRTALEYIGVAMGRKENIAFCLEMLAVMISRCEQYLQLIERARTVDQFGVKKLKFDAINQILAFYPSVDRIMTAMEQHRNDYSVIKKETALEHGMDILLVCIRSFRAFIDSSSFLTTFKDILKPAYKLPTQELHYLNYEFKAIKVVMALEPQSISFTSPQFATVLTLVTKVYLKASPNMCQEATELLLALYRNTTLFGNRTTEIEFWFQALHHLPNRSMVPEVVEYLAKSAAKAAQAVSQQSMIQRSANSCYSLLDQAFEKAGALNEDLEALFSRIEQDGEPEQRDGADREKEVPVVQLGTPPPSDDLQPELPVTDNFFLYMFVQQQNHPEQFAIYFDAVLWRYLHYLPHPEVVEKVLDLSTKNRNRSGGIADYVHGWIAGKECMLGKSEWGPFSTLSRALKERRTGVALYPTKVELKEMKQKLRPKLIHMLHQTLFHLSRLVAARTLTQQHMVVCMHYTDVLLSEMLQDGGVLSDTDISELLAGLFLGRPVLFDHFTLTMRNAGGALKKSIEAICRLVTTFVYELMVKLQHLPNFNRYIVPYSNKIVSELISSSTRELAAPGSTAFDVGLVEKFRQIIKLDELHYVSLLRHYAKLPIGAFVVSQQSGHVHTFHYNQLCSALEQLSNAGGANKMQLQQYLPEETVRGLVRIYMECGSSSSSSNAEAIKLDEFESALLGYFGTFTHSIAHVQPELMGVFFENRQRYGKPLIKLASFLLSRDARFDAPFLELVGANVSKKELVYPLLNVAFRRSIVAEDEQGKRLLAKLYAEFKGGIQKMFEKPHKAAVIYRENPIANETLVRLCMPRNECVDFARKKLRIEAVEVFQLRVLMKIYTIALETLNDDSHSGRQQSQVVYANGFAVLLQCFEVLLRSSTSAVHLLKRAEDVARMNELVLALYRWSKQSKWHQALRETNFGAVTSSANWNTFCKTCLKFGIDMAPCEGNERRYDERLHVLPKIMAVLVNTFYADDDRNHQDIEKYYEWALSHSLFLRVFLTQYHFKPKTALAQLLYVLASKNPTVIDRKHVPLLLSAYGATLSDCDRYILALLQLYERAEVQMHDFRPFLWGETAIKQYALQADDNEPDAGNERSNRYRLSFRANPLEVFPLLSKDKVTATIQQFPVWRRLDACAQLPEVQFGDIETQSPGTESGDRAGQYGYHPTSALEEFVEKQHWRRRKAPPADQLEMGTVRPEKPGMMYDPAFLVPMLGYLFMPEHGDMLQLAGRSGVIALPFACLASRDEQMRLAGGCVITRIRAHLEQTTKFIDSRFWLHLFSAVQNGLAAMQEPCRTQKAGPDQPQALPRAPFLATNFITQTIGLLPNVMSELHGPMTRYILQKDVFDFRAIPNFLNLFHSADVKHGVHRAFILETILGGIKTHEDFGVLRASPVIRALMHFYASALSNRELNVAILNIFAAITRIPKSCEALVNSFGFLGWHSQRIDAIESFHFDTIEAFLVILNNCWYSMQAMALANATGPGKGAQNKHHHQEHQHGRLPVAFSRAVLIATLKFLPLLSTRSSSVTLTRFLNLLDKTTSARYSSDRLLALVSESLLQQMLDYFEKLFGEHLGCVRYVRQCGTHSCDDEATMGRKLLESGMDRSTLSIVLGLRAFVVRWYNYHRNPASVAGALDATEDEKLDALDTKENDQGDD